MRSACASATGQAASRPNPPGQREATRGERRQTRGGSRAETGGGPRRPRPSATRGDATQRPQGQRVRAHTPRTPRLHTRAPTRPGIPGAHGPAAAVEAAREAWPGAPHERLTGIYTGTARSGRASGAMHTLSDPRPRRTHNNDYRLDISVRPDSLPTLSGAKNDTTRHNPTTRNGRNPARTNSMRAG